MRRRELTGDELDRVMRLRQAGTSWLKIQDITGIDRRKAKRAYEAWEQTQSRDELKKARQDVAARAFSEHIDILVRLAESLIRILQVPESSCGLDNADEALDRFWITDILGSEESPLSQSVGDHGKRVVWRNKLLFKSLQEHTRGRVRWQALEEWKEARNNAVRHSGELLSDAIEIAANILDGKPDLKEKVTIVMASDSPTKKIANGISENLWRGMVAGNQEPINVVKGASAMMEGKVWLEFHSGDLETRLFLNDVELASEVLSVCSWANDNLRNGLKSDLVQRLADDVCEMQGRARELQESLDELVLRPMILRTRCDLCPA